MHVIHDRVPVRDADSLVSLSAIRSRFELLYRTGKELLAASTLDDMCERALSRIFDGVSADRGAIFLGGAWDQMSMRVARDRDPTSKNDGTWMASRSVLRDAVSKCEAILVSDAGVEGRLSAQHSIRHGRIRSVLCVPLWDGASLHGAIYLDCRAQRGVFLREDLVLAAAAANLLTLRLRQESRHTTQCEERLVRSHLSPYHSAEFIDSVLRSPDRAVPPLSEADATVVFADLRGSTRMESDARPSAIASVLTAYYDQVNEIVIEHGGCVNHYSGNSVLSVFGAPSVRSDHASSAVRAAVELVRRMRARRAIAGDLLRNTQVHVGMQSGRVAVGSLGREHRLTCAVVGDAVQVAARLKHLGAPDSIHVGDGTYARARDAFPYEVLGVISIPGREEPVGVYRVTP